MYKGVCKTPLQGNWK